jgi:hypothetical protein
MPLVFGRAIGKSARSGKFSFQAARYVVYAHHWSYQRPLFRLVHAMYGDDTKKLGRDEARECKAAKNAFHLTAPVGSIGMEFTC